MVNFTIMQYFEWYLANDSTLWNKVTKEAEKLSNIGITHIWLPPAYKGSGGKDDVGYGVYDLYDLGEFNQKGTIPTKYGTKDEYLNSIKALKQNNIKILVDIVFNHKMGADETEIVLACQDDPNNRNVSLTEAKPIKAWTKYNFPERNNMYSDFKWNWTHFHGIDWDENTGTTSIYKFYGKQWDESVDKEHGNYDYLMGADIDLNNYDVRTELKKWGMWYLNLTEADGFRLDAVKHIRSDFFVEWLDYLKKETGKELFSIGEYWSTNTDILNKYIENTNACMSLMDVALHYNFHRASISNGEYNMSSIFENTLVERNPEKAITFVDNHDTQLGQALESWVSDWFKPLAYSLILLRKDGIPCVFYGDYYGTKDTSKKNEIIDLLMKLRKDFAYGEQIDYFYNQNVIGFTRMGDDEHPNSGLAVVMTDAHGGCIQMNVGKKLANTILHDCTGNLSETVYVDNEGNGIFYCKDGSVSIWVKNI